MKQFILLLCLLIAVSIPISAQKVGLVLSGGGAKGVAHIGVIKALEENDIPIDYIAGTSMGAIVGSLYAMGYTPDEMLELIKSDNFKSWQNGTISDEHTYYFNLPDPSPAFFNFKVNSKDRKNVMRNFFSGSLINPSQMNVAFVELFSQANALCDGDFSNLFVPFFCVASDVYNKKAIIIEKGNLSDAVRASMSIPFVFKPIKFDSMLVYDGGIFNNYPVKEMKEIFKPDFIIGSVVATDTKPPTNERDLMEQLEAIVMDKTDYSVNAADGVQLRFDLDAVGMLDFQKGESTAQMGYDSTINIIPKIKDRVKRMLPKSELALKRKEFKEKLPPLVFDDIIISGVEANEIEFMKSYMKHSDVDTFTIEEFKEDYFRILSDPKVNEIIPHAKYNKETKHFTLHSDVSVDDQFQASFGGNLSTMNANQVYLGFKYDRLDKISHNYDAQFQIGNHYSNVQLAAQFYIRKYIPQYFRFIANYSLTSFSDKSRLFYEFDIPSFIRKKELFFKAEYAISMGNHAKGTFGIGYGSLTDMYYQSSASNYKNADFDKSIHNIIAAKFRLEYNTLSPKMNPNSGAHHHLLLQAMKGEELYRPDQNSQADKNRRSSDQLWPQAKISLSNYFKCSKLFTLGTEVEGVYSFKPLYSNYTGSILQASAFSPTTHSKIFFNESLRANEYIAAGIKPIFNLSERLQLRTELYGFAPIREIRRGDNEIPYYSEYFRKINYFGEVSLSYEFPFISLSGFCSYYNYPSNNVYFGLNIGFLIFNKRFIE